MNQTASNENAGAGSGGSAHDSPMSDAMLGGLGTELLMRMQQQIADELERRYRKAKREQSARAKR